LMVRSRISAALAADVAAKIAKTDDATSFPSAMVSSSIRARHLIQII
jgi:hypothetical protein